MSKIRTARPVESDRYKLLETPSSDRNIKVTLDSEGGRVIYVADPVRARALKRADRFLTGERANRK